MDELLGLAAVALLLWAVAGQGEDRPGGAIEAYPLVDPSWWASATADRLGLDNYPTPEAFFNLLRLQAAVESVFGRAYRVTSGYRSAAVNGAVPGSAHTSYHLRGLAADLAVDMDLETAASMARDSGLFVEVLTYGDGHLHVAIGA